MRDTTLKLISQSSTGQKPTWLNKDNMDNPDLFIDNKKIDEATQLIMSACNAYYDEELAYAIYEVINDCNRKLDLNKGFL